MWPFSGALVDFNMEIITPRFQKNEVPRKLIENLILAKKLKYNRRHKIMKHLKILV